MNTSWDELILNKMIYPYLYIQEPIIKLVARILRNDLVSENIARKFTVSGLGEGEAYTLGFFGTSKTVLHITNPDTQTECGWYSMPHNVWWWSAVHVGVAAKYEYSNTYFPFRIRAKLLYL
jgi:hypothetical protein